MSASPSSDPLVCSSDDEFASSSLAFHDLALLESRAQTAGVREGIQFGKDQAIQLGFEEGFNSGTRAALSDGILRGMMGAIAAIAHRRGETKLAQLIQQNNVINRAIMEIQQNSSSSNGAISPDDSSIVLSSLSEPSFPLSESSLRRCFALLGVESSLDWLFSLISSVLTRHDYYTLNLDYPVHHFEYRSGVLNCEDTPLPAIIDQIGTPAYIYSSCTLEHNYRRLHYNLALRMPANRFQICFAVKSNSNLSILSLFHRLGAGFDVVSQGELQRLVAANIPLNRSVFAGVGKTEGEIRYALEHGIFSFHVESEAELERINRIAAELGVRAPIALRVNPDVEAETHAKITTGKAENKFGVSYEAALSFYEKAQRMPAIRVRGIQMHIGSQLLRIEPYANALQRMLPLVRKVKEMCSELEYFSVGGGIGVEYEEARQSGKVEWWQQTSGNARQRPFKISDFCDLLSAQFRSLGLKLLLEPGRSLVANSGVLVSRVEYLKQAPVDGAKRFCVLDCGMNTLIRPAMYDARHQIEPIIREQTTQQTADVNVEFVGPICESSDVFGVYSVPESFVRQIGTDRPAVERPCVAIFSSGAYGFSMSNHYNSHPRAAEVLVQKTRIHTIRARETFQQMIETEANAIPTHLIADAKAAD